MILKAIRRFYLEDSAGTCGTPMHLLSWSFISRSLIYLLHRWHNSVRFPHTSCYKSQIHYTRTLSINTTDPHRLMCVSTDLYIHRNNHKFVLNFNIYVCVQREREREREKEKWWSGDGRWSLQWVGKKGNMILGVVGCLWGLGGGGGGGGVVWENWGMALGWGLNSFLLLFLCLLMNFVC